MQQTYYYILKTIPIMIMRHIRVWVVIHVPRVVFYLSLRLRLLLLLCRVVILVPRFFLYLRLLLLCRIVILVPRLFFYLRLQLGLLLLLLLSPICSFFGNTSGIIVVVPRLLCDISFLWMP
jgi:hypothetical protein